MRSCDTSAGNANEDIWFGRIDTDLALVAGLVVCVKDGV